MRTKIEPGVRVAYARAWLRSTGMLTGPIPFARGTVREVNPFGAQVLARVEWDGGDDSDMPSLQRVLACNLVAVADIPHEPV